MPSEPTEGREAASPEARIYPCEDCGVLRSKNEGGTIFTVCDDCWDKAYAGVRALMGEGE